jgi:hypothetical protein
LIFASPSYAADSIVKPSLSAEKNFMVGTNATITAAQQNPATLTSYKNLVERKIYTYLSRQATCSSDANNLVGAINATNITAKGLASTSINYAIPNNDIAGFYLCTYERLTYTRIGVLISYIVYSDRTGALISPFQVDWGAIAPKIVIIPPIAPASESPAPTESATPTPSPSELPSPTGFKATFVSEPSIDDPIQTLVKAWDLKGNEFKARTVKLRLCSDDKCQSVLSTLDVVASSSLNEKTAKTFTMSEKLGTVENYVQVVDALTYRNANLAEDKTVRTYSEVKKLITTKVFPSQSPTASAAPTTESAAPEVTAEASSSSSITGIAIGVLSTLLIVALVAIFLILRKKKGSEETKS